jgi:hypothetical protein
MPTIYTDDELNLLAYVPQVIGTAIASATNSGIIGTGKELFASASALMEGIQSYPGNSLIRRIVPDPVGDRTKLMEQMKKSRSWAQKRMSARGVNSAEKLRTLMLEDTRAASAILASKASPAEASEYKQWALSVAEKVANASSEGGFLGFGAQRLSAAERALIDQVKSALGFPTGDGNYADLDREPSRDRNDTSGRSAAVATASASVSRLLAGRKVVITAGPTHESIDGSHYLAKHSSGKLGYTLAEVAVGMGAQTVLISGPVNLALPPGAAVIPAETANDMLKVCQRELPCDIAIFAAAVSDWRVDPSSVGALAKRADGTLEIKLLANPDIVKNIATRTEHRPKIVLGFAAETGDVIESARRTLTSKGCDLIIANDAEESKTNLARDRDTFYVVSKGDAETWPRLRTREVADRLLQSLADRIRGH